MSGKPALLPLPTYILLGSRNRKLLFADRIGCTIGGFFLREPATGTWPAQKD